MKSLVKLDLWLLRWALLVVLILAPITGAFFYTGTSMTGLILVFVISLTLTQMDEKQKTRRFMLSLPLPLKTFFQARTFAVIFIGTAWLILKLLGSIIGLGDPAFGSTFIHAITQFATIIVLAPIAVAMLTLFHHPVLKYGLTFLVYMGAIMVGTLFGFLIDSLTYFGRLAYVLSGVSLVLAGGLCWFILFIANRIRARVDLV